MSEKLFSNKTSYDKPPSGNTCKVACVVVDRSVRKIRNGSNSRGERLTPGVLPTYRKPGRKTLPRLYYSAQFTPCQHF